MSREGYSRPRPRHSTTDKDECCGVRRACQGGRGVSFEILQGRDIASSEIRPVEGDFGRMLMLLEEPKPEKLTFDGRRIFHKGDEMRRLRRDIQSGLHDPYPPVTPADGRRNRREPFEIHRDVGPDGRPPAGGERTARSVVFKNRWEHQSLFLMFSGGSGSGSASPAA